jgi:hypothetical protein
MRDVRAGSDGDRFARKVPLDLECRSQSIQGMGLPRHVLNEDNGFSATLAGRSAKRSSHGARSSASATALNPIMVATLFLVVPESMR